MPDQHDLLSDEARLLARLRAVEALHAGATTGGERVAAEHARRRILEHLQRLQAEDPVIEVRFTMPDMWSRKVFVALARRYGLRPYRYVRQRHTTVMLKAPRRFVDETLWPEFEELHELLHEHLSRVTDRVVSDVLHPDTSDAATVPAGSLPPAPTEPPPAPPAAPPDGPTATEAKTEPASRRRRRKKGKRKKGRRGR